MPSSGQSSFTTTGENSSSTGSSLSQIAMDSFIAQITNHKLSGHNYLSWSKSVRMFIRGKGKDDFLTDESVQPTETSALNSVDSNAFAAKGQIDNRPRKGRPPTGDSSNCTANASVTTPAFNKEQMEILQQLISTTPSVQANTVMHKNSEHKALLTSADNLSWIVDSGASDHMTGNSSLFSTLNSCNSSATVTIADGSKSSIKGVGTVKLSEKLTLNQVFYIPDLKYNLLSVSKLNKDLKCLTVFESNLCLFQDGSQERRLDVLNS
ncbi:uncharacterized protein LOC106753340 [Vigna radiata var. radiata]|uniref:Uncharacterized protein LOC106753340 n=1 Tax=Vigna radiata var. radiata TaxID=3916 RepID=A0A1S3TA36_VIGRR|nr:uncharacterized protein LOC106753340 [Vigna radiata var. radiata]